MSSITRTVFLIALCLLSTYSKATTYYAVVTGNWNSLTTWTTVACGSFIIPPTLPTATDDVIVCNGVGLTCNINTTINSLTVNNNAIFQNGGGSTTNRSVTITNTLTVLNGGTLVQHSFVNPTTTLFAGTEFFSPTSLVRVNNWFSNTMSLVTSVSSNFGHVNLNFTTGASWWNNQSLGVTRLIQGDLIVGPTCQTFLDNSTSNVTISLCGNLQVDGKIRIKDSNSGSVSFSVVGNGILNATGRFTGIANGSNNFIFNINNLTTVAGSIYDGILDGIGNTTININGVFTSTGDFYGINAPTILNNGVPTLTIHSLSYSNGIFMASNAHNINGLATVNILSHATINFTAVANKINLLGLATLSGVKSNTRLLFTVGGNLSISGVSTGEFKTSESSGEETTIVNGTFTSTGAKTIFNGSLDETNGHKVYITLGGLLMSGGVVWFSENASDSTFLTVNGTVQLSGGIAILKSSTGRALFTVNGLFTQNLVSSVFYLHGYNQLSQTSTANDTIELTVNGDFVQSGGILYFDDFDSPSLQQININGPIYTISNSASMLRAGSGSSLNFSRINFMKQGTITYFRNLSHNIRQCKQYVKAGCTVDVTSGPLQICSHNSPMLDMLTVESGGVLSVGANQISSDTVYTYTGVTVANDGRLRLARPQGLYDNTNNPVLRKSGNMNYFLGANSIVEYNTNTYGFVSGINVGVATLTQHKYGILEINHVGPSNTWVSPTYMPSFTNAVYVRTQLRITAGEFNLCDAPGNPGSAGRYVFIENANPTAIVRTGGYIRSEATNHSGRIVWTMSSTAGTYTIPFGYSSTDYIPLTYQLLSGNAGTVSFSTYHTPATNLPWPPGVTNLASNFGLAPDNRTATVDRFWRISGTGATNVYNLNFTYVASELPGIPFNTPNYMWASAYSTTTNAWLPLTVGQTSSPYQVNVPLATRNIHWALAAGTSYLPLEWGSVMAEPSGKDVKIKWSTLSEKNTDFFTVFKSKNNSNFVELGSVAASGNSNEVRNYSLLDQDAFSTDAYYKVKETDFNGDQYWSEVVYYKSQKKKNEISAWFNVNNSSVQIILPELSSGIISIYDLTGRLLFEKNIVNESSLLLPIDLPRNSVYLLRFLSEEGIYSTKF
ncbi:MAG: T9SS type A sorting domain-containing protein [Bacteroidetes bacterium]|nr:T9SS type A sorting domain-containing protein [Bacteroidota bacterium]